MADILSGDDQLKQLGFIPTQLADVQKQFGLQEEAAPAMPEIPSYSPQASALQDQLRSRASEMLMKSAQGMTGRERGGMIGEQLFGSLVAPAMGLFGGDGSAAAGVQLAQESRARLGQMKQESMQKQNSYLDALKSFAGMIQSGDNTQAKMLGNQIKMAHEQNMRQHRQQQQRQKLAAMVQKHDMDIANVAAKFKQLTQEGKLKEAQALKLALETKLMPARQAAQNAHDNAMTEFLGVKKGLYATESAARTALQEALAAQAWETMGPRADMMNAMAGQAELRGELAGAQADKAGAISDKQLLPLLMGVAGPEMAAMAKQQLQSKLQMPPAPKGFAQLPPVTQPTPQQLQQVALPVTPAKKAAPTNPAGGAQAAMPKKATGVKSETKPGKWSALTKTAAALGLNPEPIIKKMESGSDEDRRQILQRLMQMRGSK